MFIVYLVLSAVGLVGTWAFNIRSSRAGEDYVAAWFGTNASSSAAVDVIVVAVAASIFMVVEGRRIGLPVLMPIMLVVLSFVVAIAFTFPLFLALRHRVLARRPDPTAAAVAS